MCAETDIKSSFSLSVALVLVFNSVWWQVKRYSKPESDNSNYLGVSLSNPPRHMMADSRRDFSAHYITLSGSSKCILSVIRQSQSVESWQDVKRLCLVHAFAKCNPAPIVKNYLIKSVPRTPYTRHFPRANFGLYYDLFSVPNLLVYSATVVSLCSWNPNLLNNTYCTIYTAHWLEIKWNYTHRNYKYFHTVH